MGTCPAGHHPALGLCRRSRRSGVGTRYRAKVESEVFAAFRKRVRAAVDPPGAAGRATDALRGLTTRQTGKARTGSKRPNSRVPVFAAAQTPPAAVLARALTSMRGAPGSSCAEAPRNHDACYLGRGRICSCWAAGNVLCVYPTVQEDWRPC